MRELAAAGKGIIMISSELSELLTACDRILVMADGRVQDLPREALDDPDVPADDQGASTSGGRAAAADRNPEGPCGSGDLNG